MKIGRILFLLILALWHITSHADTYTIDKRKYVDWSDSKYNNIVAFWDGGHICTAQYIAKDIILTAAHCISPNETQYEISKPGQTHDIPVTLLQYQYGGPYGNTDWAILRVDKPEGYNDTFFEVSSITPPKQSQLTNIGFGSVKILSDEQIQSIKNQISEACRQYSNCLDVVQSQVLSSVRESNDFDGSTLKENSDCSVVDIPDNYYFQTNCQAHKGNSGGAYLIGNKVYGIVSHDHVQSRTHQGTTTTTRFDFGQRPEVFYDTIKEYLPTSQSTGTTKPANQASPALPAPEIAPAIAAETPPTTPATPSTPTSTERAPIVTKLDNAPATTTIPTGQLATVPNTISAPAITPQAAQSSSDETPQALEQDITQKQDDLNKKLENIDSASGEDVLNILFGMSELERLQEKYEKAKAREQSTANKLLGGAAIGATGIGAMNLMEGLAEQKADDAIEQEMKAYLETFTCDYGQGRNIKGGTREVELPGATQLFAQVNEYKALAADLKARKEALGLRAGIESEVILDKAETGLYDDVGVGITSGAYTSVARALQDPTGKDAESWAKTKQDAHDKKNKGLITAGVGAIGGAAGNLIINKDAGDDKKPTANTVK